MPVCRLSRRLAVLVVPHVGPPTLAALIVYGVVEQPFVEMKNTVDHRRRSATTATSLVAV